MTVLTPEVDNVSAPGSNHLLKELPVEKLAWMLNTQIRTLNKKQRSVHLRLVHGTMHLSIDRKPGSDGRRRR
jgi:hypothetical protein